MPALRNQKRVFRYMGLGYQTLHTAGAYIYLQNFPETDITISV